MSTVGHLVVGASATSAIPPFSSRPKHVFVTLLVVLCAVVPDVDLVLGVLAGSGSTPFAHRGPTHSLVAALVVTGLMGLLGHAFGMPAIRIMMASGISVGSHALLDSLTAGPGVQWLWPFYDARLPSVAVLPLAPVDHLFSLRGIVLLAAEVVVLSPLLVVARLVTHRRNQRSRRMASA